MRVPQADNVAKIIDIPLAVANGAASTEAAARRYGFNRRQAQYYFDAAEMLGFIIRGKRGYLLSPLGRKHLALSYSERKRLLVKRMLSLDVMTAILSELFASSAHRLSYREIEGIVSGQSRLSAITVRRRARTLTSWFRWIAQETRSFRVNKRGIVLSVRE